MFNQWAERIDHTWATEKSKNCMQKKSLDIATPYRVVLVLAGRTGTKY